LAGVAQSCKGVGSAISREKKWEKSFRGAPWGDEKKGVEQAAAREQRFQRSLGEVHFFEKHLL